MAELIPLQYRIKIASRRHLEIWGMVNVIVLAICATVYLSFWAMNIRAQKELDTLSREHESKLPLIQRANLLCKQREILAERMATIEALRDDKTILTTLTEIANSFSSEHDHLESLRITNTAEVVDKDKTTTPPTTIAKIIGHTENSETMGNLMTRLSQAKSPNPINVQLTASRSEDFLAKTIMHFQLTCQRIISEPKDKNKTTPQS